MPVVSPITAYLSLAHICVSFVQIHEGLTHRLVIGRLVYHGVRPRVEGCVRMANYVSSGRTENIHYTGKRVPNMSCPTDV